MGPSGQLARPDSWGGRQRRRGLCVTRASLGSDALPARGPDARQGCLFKQAHQSPPLQGSNVHSMSLNSGVGGQVTQLSGPLCHWQFRGTRLPPWWPGEASPEASCDFWDRPASLPRTLLAVPVSRCAAPFSLLPAGVALGPSLLTQEI